MTNEQRALLDKAARSLEAAELLRQDGFDEFAASRAYYCMFYCARASLLAIGQEFKSHSALIAAFGRWLNETKALPVELHRFPMEAQRVRIAADYSVQEFDTGAGSTEQLLSQAGGFLAEVRWFLES